MEIIRRIQGGAFGHAEFDDTPDYVDYFSGLKEVMPIMAVPDRKSSFQPSKYEMMKVVKIVKAMEEGRYVSLKERAEQKLAEINGTGTVYEIWNEAEDEILAESRRFKFHLPAPKMPLPGHAESYNPPEEYLLTEDEQNEQAKLDPTDRKFDFLPKKHACLRHVGGYKNFIRERFERCLDLYLCPRQLKRRLNIDPETLLPQLPKPRDLKPFPNALCLQYIGHKGAVRAISVSQDGQYLATGGEDGTVRLWEVDTCLCRRVWTLGEPITSLAFNPAAENHVIAASSGNRVVLITPGTGDRDATEVTETLMTATLEGAQAEAEEEGQDIDDGGERKTTKKALGAWRKFRGNGEDEGEGSGGGAQWNDAPVGCRLELVLPSKVTYLVWHGKGDYLAVLAPDAGAQSVTIHQISRGASQAPFAKAPGLVQCFCFHPTRPFFFVATQQYVKVYHLVEQKQIKKLSSGCKWISSMDVHSSGDHVVIGSYDRRLVWFDMDLGSTPYKTLKFHEKALRQVRRNRRALQATDPNKPSSHPNSLFFHSLLYTIHTTRHQVTFHKRYPLLASASDDGAVHIFHATVYSDLERNPMVVPLKVLKGHGVNGGGKSKLGVLACAFHPRQPWLFSAGADGVINLFQDL
jgi:ribosome biogenesis protein ERB1